MPTGFVRMPMENDESRTEIHDYRLKSRKIDHIRGKAGAIHRKADEKHQRANVHPRKADKNLEKADAKRDFSK